MVEYFVAPGPAGLHDLLAQPHQRAARLRLRHVRRGSARGQGRGGRDHRQPFRPFVRRVLRRPRRGRRRQPCRRAWHGFRPWEPDAPRLRDRQRSGGHGLGTHEPRDRCCSDRRVGAQGIPRWARARRASSRGCAPTTSSGRTWSTTTCSARSRRRSTSCTGTRIPCASPPGCIAISSVWPWRTRWCDPVGLSALGTPVDLSTVDVDVYAVAGLTDHIVPWENAYRSTQLFGGARRFVLSASGHIQALVNPPSPTSRSSYRVTDNVAPTEEEFLERAPTSCGQLVVRLRRLAGATFWSAQTGAVAHGQRAVPRPGRCTGRVRARRLTPFVRAQAGSLAARNSLTMAAA